MLNKDQKPVVFLAFANVPKDKKGHLPSLSVEHDLLKEILQPIHDEGLIRLEIVPFANSKNILEGFSKFRNRISIFHFAGHAGNWGILLEAAGLHEKVNQAVDATALSKFLALQNGLDLVFLNGCSTNEQAMGLLAADVSAVIATDRPINDEKAAVFAAEFYKRLVADDSLEQALKWAQDAPGIGGSDDTRDMVPEAGDQPTSDGFQWYLHMRPDPVSDDDPGEQAHLYTEVSSWKFSTAYNSPLLGLKKPKPAEGFLDNPYEPPNGYKSENWEYFFGRNKEIRALFDRVIDTEAAPIVLYYGQALVGKSSLLEAGLTPYLEHEHTVLFCRVGDGSENGDAGDLCGNIKRKINEQLKKPLDSEDHAPLLDYWKALNGQDSRPVTLIVDQFEEAIVSSGTKPDELEKFWKELKPVLEEAPSPVGKVILSYRKELGVSVIEEIKRQELNTKSEDVSLKRLDVPGMMEVIRGPTQVTRLNNHHRLQILDETPDGDLARLIAEDLAEDRGSAISVTLQLLLSEMWIRANEKASASEEDVRVFDKDLYDDLRTEGSYLEKFLSTKLDYLEKLKPEFVTSGLVLDLLEAHTTKFNKAETLTEKQVKDRYAHRKEDALELVQACKKLGLLVDARDGGKNSSRLKHDVLAPLVHNRFIESDLPGQRARRILENKAVLWAWKSDDSAPEKEEPEQEVPGLSISQDKAKTEALTGSPLDRSFQWKMSNCLDDTDLRLVLEGEGGMRAPTRSEAALTSFSKKARRLRWAVRTGLPILFLILVVAASFKIHSANLTSEADKKQKELAENRRHAAAVITNAEALLKSNDPTTAALLIASLEGYEEPAQGVRIAHAIAKEVIQKNEFAATRFDEVNKVFEGITGVACSNVKDPELANHVLVTATDGSVRILDLDEPDNFSEMAADCPIRRAIFNPDSDEGGPPVATYSEDQTIRVWDSGEEWSSRVVGLQANVNSLEFSPDGRFILTATRSGGVRIWNVEEPLPPGQFDAGNCAPDMLETPAGSNEALVTLGQTYSSAIFSPDNDWVLATTADGKSAHIYLAIDFRENRGTQMQKQGEIDLGESGLVIQGAVFSTDSDFILLLHGNRNPATLWAWDGVANHNPTPLDEIGLETVKFAAFADRRKLITISHFDELTTWDIQEHEEGVSLVELTRIEKPRHWEKINGMDYCPDNDEIVTAEDGKSLAVWSAAGPVEPVVLARNHTLDRTLAAHGATFDREGHQVAVAFERQDARILRTHDSGRAGETGARISSDPIPVAVEASSVDFHPSGDRFLTVSKSQGKISEWKIEGNNLPASEPLTMPCVGLPEEARYNHDGSEIMLVCGEDNQYAMKWERQTGLWTPLEWEPPGKDQWAVHHAEYSHTGQGLVIAFSANYVLVGQKDHTSSQAMPLAHTRTVHMATFNPVSDKIATASNDKWIRVYEKGEGNTWNLGRRHAAVENMTSVDFSPDDRYLLGASSGGATMVWDVEGTGETVVIEQGNEKITSAEFGPAESPFEGRILTASEDGHVRLWRYRWEDLRHSLSESTKICLTKQERIDYLGEEGSVACDRFRSCSGNENCEN